jgi:hypothetical protein
LFYLLSAPADPTSWSERVAGSLIGVLMLGITVLIAAMVISYAFSGLTIIYALMRKKVDKTPIRKVWVHFVFNQGAVEQPADGPQKKDEY